MNEFEDPNNLEIKKKKINKTFKKKLDQARENKRIDKTYDKHMQILMLLYVNNMDDNLPFVSKKKIEKEPNEVFAMLYRYYTSNVWEYNPSFMTKRDLLKYKK